LVLDDLHWADAGTLLLMRHVIVNDPVAQLLVVGTYRDTDLDRTHPLAGMLGELRRRADVTRISLDGLDIGEVTDLMSLAARHDLPEDGVALALAVQEETGGNPFFVGEVLRHLVESGAIVQSEGRWVAARPGEDRLLPEGIREVVGRRVSALPESTQRALSTAAVIGVEFHLDVLAAVAGQDEDELIDALEPALAAHLVTEAGVDHYRFAHALVRQTLHAELSTSRRARVHRSVAQTLETMHAHDLDAVTTELAYHWGEAGPATAHEQAIAYAQRAAELASARVAPEEAARWYEQARDLLDGTDPVLDAELACRWAQARALAGVAGWRDAMLEAALAAEEIGDIALTAESLCINRRMVLTEGSPEEADLEKIELLERAVAAAPQDDPMLWARLNGALASELIYTGDLDRRRSICESVQAYADEMPDPIERWRMGSTVVPATPFSARNRSRAEDGRTNAIAAADVARGSGDCLAEAEAVYGVTYVSIGLGLPTYRDALLRLENLLVSYPHPGLQDGALLLQMCAALIDGRLAAAESIASRVATQWVAHGRGPEGRVYSESGLLQVVREKSGLVDLLDVLKASPLYAMSKPGVMHALVALALAEDGQSGEARAL
ncbi:MAG TPA: hypothetical protein VGR90_09055, partial [Acidimicrobiales bacterium]|nr:hypothetical protein [Acidimicrobiales bacterium]